MGVKEGEGPGEQIERAAWYPEAARAQSCCTSPAKYCFISYLLGLYEENFNTVMLL